MMMKHILSFSLVGLGAIALAGCPIYSDDQSRDYVLCAGDDCFRCPAPFISDDCSTIYCRTNSECGSDYVCSASGRCAPPATVTPACTEPSQCASGTNCGADGRCHAGDCSTSGCPSSYVCKLDGGAPACVRIDDNNNTSTCKSNNDCPTPAGSKCLSGTCVAPADQCVDATQCASGSQCVDGVCTPSCSASKPCPTGYACDDKGVCTGSNGTCSSSSECSGANVCVQRHCVAPCNAGQCEGGLVCVDGGCMPNQQPIFTCDAEGQRDRCQEGSICLRHSCYIACDAAQGNADCTNADAFNECKTVTTSSGDYSVCGSASNLGNDCDPTRACTQPLLCIDGYCR